MNAFDQARKKYEKNKERRERVPQDKPEVVETAPAEPLYIEPFGPLPPKQRGSDGLIRVTVELPDRDFTFTLRKRGIASNVQKSKLNENEFKRAITAGLVPLLGGVDELS